MPVEELTHQRLMFEVERVLQSYEELYINQRFDINLVHVRLPSGSGRKKVINMNKRLKDKHCFIRIKNPDELCMARAIAVGLARLEKDPKYDDIYRGRPLQRTRALTLHQQAGVSLQPCGIEEAKKFQAVLADYQLVIVSAEHFDSIIFKGPTQEKVIYLYLHHGHYDLITSMSGFMGRNYYCLECEKGYNTEEGRHHRCKKKCLSCFQEGCRGDISSWIYCAYCRRSFQGPGCFENHRRMGPQGGISVCKQYLKCKDCGKMLDRTRRDVNLHKCGEVMCRVCDKFVDKDHQCFMQVPKQGKKRKREDDEEQEDTYLFFDFECIQDTGSMSLIWSWYKINTGRSGCLKRARHFAPGCLTRCQEQPA